MIFFFKTVTLFARGRVAFLLREERAKEGASQKLAVLCRYPCRQRRNKPTIYRNSVKSQKLFQKLYPFRKGMRAFLLREERAKEGAKMHPTSFKKSLVLRLAAKWPFLRRPKAFSGNSKAVLVPLESPTKFRCNKAIRNHRAGNPPTGYLGAAVHSG